MNAPTKTEVLQLYNLTLQEAELGFLPSEQSTRFGKACERILDEFQEYDIHEHIIAAKIYLRYIRSFPHLDLPQ